MNIGIIVGSNRPNRKGSEIAAWIKKTTDADTENTYTYLDLAEIGLPFLDEPKLPAMGDYQNDHTKAWAEKVAAQDGFVMIIPEYNHGYPASLKNAIDTLYAEWVKKPVVFVGYGAAGAARSIDHIASVVLNVELVPLISTSATTNIMLFQSLDENGLFAPNEHHQSSLDSTLSTLKKWIPVIKENRDRL